MKELNHIYIMDHPLIQHKISQIRDIHTGTYEFRKCIEEIAMLMGYEALRDLPLEMVKVETPIETCMTPKIAGKKLAVVPILRAGLGMVNGILALVPSAKVGHIGLYRDPETREPHEYYCKFRNPLSRGRSWWWTLCLPPVVPESRQLISSNSMVVRILNLCVLLPLRKDWSG